MGKKVNFIWLYAIILFLAALFLILISALSQIKVTLGTASGQTELEKLQAFNQTAQQSIASLTEENRKYKDQTDQFAKNQEELIQIRNELTETNSKLSSLDTILTARGHYTANEFTQAKETLEILDYSILTAAAQAEYDSLKQLLARKGYTF